MKKIIIEKFHADCDIKVYKKLSFKNFYISFFEYRFNNHFDDYLKNTTKTNKIKNFLNLYNIYLNNNNVFFVRTPAFLINTKCVFGSKINSVARAVQSRSFGSICDIELFIKKNTKKIFFIFDLSSNEISNETTQILRFCMIDRKTFSKKEGEIILNSFL